MKMQEIVKIAKGWGVAYKIGLSKADLIWAIQEKEGYRACFRRDAHCDGQECLWKDDCVAGK